MATIKPFKAHRPKPEFVTEIACVPYDVVNTKEAKTLSEGKPDSFLHVIRPEIDLPVNTHLYSSDVYEKGKVNLSKLLNSDLFTQEDENALYIYRLSWEDKSQTGVFGCVSVHEYDNDVILKHELTRPDKEDDRTKHILTQQAHAEPVMMTFKDNPSIKQHINVAATQEPIFNFEAVDGVTHTIWKIEDSAPLVKAFAEIRNLYIADGHHRCASASRAAKDMESMNPDHTGEEEYNFFPAVLFPMNEMNILPYNRIVFNIPDNFLNKLSSKFDLNQNAVPDPAKKGDISLYLDRHWFGLRLPDSQKQDAASKLDVARLQEYILEPMLGISNQRTDENISFVGGIRGTKELEELVNSGQAQLAISMFATDISELVDVSDEGLLMPPKSTWFEPKLRSGLLIHTF